MTMDYAKSGNPKSAKDSLRHRDPGPKPVEGAPVKGSTKKPNVRPSKEELLARLKTGTKTPD